MRMRLLVLLGCFAVAGCGADPDAEAGAQPDTLTQEQRDSAIGASGLPGAGAVNRALDASRTMEERAARMDSVRF